MLAEPSKEFPAMFLAVVSVVAVSACKFATSVVEATVNGAVPVEALNAVVEVNVLF